MPGSPQSSQIEVISSAAESSEYEQKNPLPVVANNNPSIWRWSFEKLHRLTKSVVLGSALFPMEDSGPWAARVVVAGALVNPIYDAVDELVNKNQDVRVLLRAEHSSGSAIAGFAKKVGKHIFAPTIPVAFAAACVADPEKDFGHPFAYATLHAGLGYIIYEMSSTLAEYWWPRAEDVSPQPLSKRAECLQNYLFEPLSASFLRTLLMAEFLRRTELEFFIDLETKGMHAPVVFGLLNFMYRSWRAFTEESRKIQQDVGELSPSKNEELQQVLLTTSSSSPEIKLTINEERNEEVIDEEEKSSHMKKVGQTAWNIFKGAVTYGGGILGHVVYSFATGTTTDDDLLHRTRRNSAVASGIYLTAGLFKVAENMYKHKSLFCNQNEKKMNSVPLVNRR